MSGQVDGTNSFFSAIANYGTKYSPNALVKNDCANISGFSFDANTKSVKFTATMIPTGISQLKFTMLN